jgi:hypothetical protein
MPSAKTQPGGRFAGLALASLFSVGLLAQDGPGSKSLAPTREAAVHERIVRAAYDRLRGFSAASGKQLTFELTDFRDYPKSAWTGVQWGSLVDLPGGALIDMLRDVQENALRGHTSVTYRPKWNDDGQGERAAPQETAELLAGSAAQVLERVGREKPEHGRIHTITSYRVTVTLEGRTRSYRAAFAWLPSTVASTYTFFVADTIVQGVQESARELLPTLAEAEFQRRPSANSIPGDVTCDLWANTQPNVQSDTSSGDHIWGQHKAEAEFELKCTCNTACTSICEAKVADWTCSDSGVTWLWCHSMSNDAKGKTTYVDYNSGAATGAACAAGFACGEKDCLLCAFCGASVSVSIVGVSVSFSMGSSDWSRGFEAERTCPRCVPTAAGGGTGGGGGGGGGGTGGGGYCSNGTLYNFDCGNDGSWDFMGECVTAGQSAVDVGCDLCFGASASALAQGALGPGSNMVATCSGLRVAPDAASQTVRAEQAPTEALKRR